MNTRRFLTFKNLKRIVLFTASTYMAATSPADVTILTADRLLDPRSARRPCLAHGDTTGCQGRDSRAAPRSAHCAGAAPAHDLLKFLPFLIGQSADFDRLCHRVSMRPSGCVLTSNRPRGTQREHQPVNLLGHSTRHLLRRSYGRWGSRPSGLPPATSRANR